MKTLEGQKLLKGKVRLTLTSEELYLVVEALDSHAYWQLSDPLYRNSGFVMEPGTDDPEQKPLLDATNKLHEKLEPELVPYLSNDFYVDRRKRGKRK